MDPECVKPENQEKMLPEPSSPPSSENPKPKILWSEMKLKTVMSDLKLKLKEESLNYLIPSNMVSSMIGMKWKKSGTIVSTMN